jgi:hypothetical protein
MYFLSYVLFLFFFRILEDKETMLLFKPVILASITFYYVSQSKIKKNHLHFVVIGLCFISDNMNLFGETLLHMVSIAIYLVVLFILLYFIIKDSKLLKKGTKAEKYFGVAIFIAILLFLIAKLTSVFIVKTKIHHYYFIFNYVVVFLSVLFLSFYNFLKHKTESSKFLVLTLLALFFSDFFSVLNAYYFTFKPMVYLACAFEIPSYFFLIKYFIARDKEAIK